MKVNQIGIVGLNTMKRPNSSFKSNVFADQNLFNVRTAQPLNFAQSQAIKSGKIGHAQNISQISFSGSFKKNPRQIASISAEYQKLLDVERIYKLGGVGNVAMEGADAFAAKGMDVRTFCPYYSPNNPDGKMQVITPKKDSSGSVIQDQYVFKAVNPDYKLQEGENFVLHSFDETVTSKDEGKKYVLLERVEGVGGKIKSIDENLKGMDETTYQLFKVKNRPDICGKEGKPDDVYIVYTPGTAKYIRSYNDGAGSSGAYGGGYFQDLEYALFDRAAVRCIKQLSQKTGDEKFDPASIWLHDRQAFVASAVIAGESAEGDDYWDGVKTDSRFHNPGKDYQGRYEDPVDFFRIIGSEKDFETLKANKESYDFVLAMAKKVQDTRKSGNSNKKFDTKDILSGQEFTKLKDIFEPLIGQFRDETGFYNMCKIPIVAKRLNPYNTELGTVSVNYGREMKNHNTPEIAENLTRDFASLNTIDITNGSSAKSLALDAVGNFGSVGNGFTDEVKKGFTPLTASVTENADTFDRAKKDNVRWFINTLATATKGGNDALCRLMFNVDSEFQKIVDSLVDNKLITTSNKDEAKAKLKELESMEAKKAYLISLGGDSNKEKVRKEIEKNLPTIVGGLSDYQEGDKLFISWGRPDQQKGFPTTLEAFAQVFEDKEIPDDVKKHIKVVVGAGVWDKSSQEWQDIAQNLERIKKAGYAGNAVYVDGFFANRTVACADWSIITSRYEPCGITPLESYAGGTPVISIKTGGSPDFITPYDGTNADKATGFLTKHAYKVSPEVIGAPAGIKDRELDVARRKALGAEAAECIKQAMSIDNEQYKQMAFNCFKLPIDWNENAPFNGGKPAIDRYIGDVFNLDSKKGFEQLGGMERNTGKLVKLTGSTAGDSYVPGGKATIRQLSDEEIKRRLSEDAKKVDVDKFEE